MKPIIIIGAGITGCVIAHGLAKKGYKVILVEKESQIGGLAKTFRYGDLSFDIGPHRFFTHKKQIYNFIIDILKDNYAVMPRKSEVYFLGNYYVWPLRPAVLFKLPLPITLKSCWDLFLMSLRIRKKKIDTFEDYVLTNYGPSLYNVFFKEYTQKFFGLSPQEIHSEWAQEGMKRTIIDERIASRNLFDILKLFLNFNPPKTKFIYPQKGIGEFCMRLAQRIRESGGGILLNSDITHFKHCSGKIEEIFFKESSLHPQMVIWTGSLNEICRLLKVSSKGLEYLCLLLFNLEINRSVEKVYQWCYYGSKDIIFSRVSMPLSFSKSMAPQNKTSFCVEVTCRQGDYKWNNPELLLERVKSDLMKVGLIGQLKDVGEVHIEKIRDAYPIYNRNYQQYLSEVKGELSKFKNLFLAGRTGLFKYNNMDNSIENGLEVIKDVMQEAR